MNNFSKLSNILSESITMNKARMTCLNLIIVAIIQAQSCNLRKVAQHFANAKKTDTNYRRIQRFMAGISLNQDELAKFIFNLFEFDKVTLSIDRTNWKWGKKNINIFMLSVVHHGIAIPLYWDMLDKKGCSNSPERIDLIERFIDPFGKDKIEYLLADREFIGEKWFKWLKDAQIKFGIRIKKTRRDSIVTDNGYKCIP